MNTIKLKMNQTYRNNLTRHRHKSRNLRTEEVGRSDETTTANRGSASAAKSEYEQDHFEDQDYGFAYSQSYEGGFYYGDLRTSEGSLPQCFPEDFECQSVSNTREALMLGISFSIVALVIIVVVICYLVHKARRGDADWQDPRQ